MTTNSTPPLLPGEDSLKPTAQVKSVSRNQALDFTKGALVLIMVLYHWINYFLVGQDNRYLRFLTPSFIFITGFIVSNVYLSKYAASDPKLVRRLIERGLKILGVFLLLNLARMCFFTKDFDLLLASGQFSPRSLFQICIIGTGVGGGQSKLLVFYILVPIGYLLIVAALLVTASRFPKYVVSGACLVSFLCVIGLSLFGLQSPNLELISIGLLGMLVGYLPTERLNDLVRHPIFLSLAYVLYLSAITVWNVIYPLQIAGVCLSLMIIYLLGLHVSSPQAIRAVILLLGKYSLVGYIAQIAILQMLRRASDNFDSSVLISGITLVLALVLTFATVKAVDILRTQSSVVDKLYKAVFA